MQMSHPHTAMTPFEPCARQRTVCASRTKGTTRCYRAYVFPCLLCVADSFPASASRRSRVTTAAAEAASGPSHDAKAMDQRRPDDCTEKRWRGQATPSLAESTRAWFRQPGGPALQPLCTPVEPGRAPLRVKAMHSTDKCFPTPHGSGAQCRDPAVSWYEMTATAPRSHHRPISHARIPRIIVQRRISPDASGVLMVLASTSYAKAFAGCTPMVLRPG
jgi:hypothetical protein